MSALRILTVDDEPLALRRLQVVLSSMEEITHVGAATGRAEATRMIAERRPDVVLLDIKLRDGSGFDVIDRMPSENCPAVIFVTAFDDFAARAFDVSAADYVLKPVSFDRLHRALERARAQLRTRDSEQRVIELRAIVDTLRRNAERRQPPRYEAEFWVRRNLTGFVRVPVDSIDRISAEDDYVCLHTQGREHLLRETVSGVMARLDPSLFTRVHRSTLVRIGAIAEVRRSAIGALEILLTGGERVKVGRVYAKHLRNVLG